ncbi:MAG TPA: 2-C-methyl-D-erythritol 2,4-cyclodiphosphate synthase [Candidatus Binataceae bacterium]|nr:2-C-methyl-D-erythritol 2,4-cyclodiphosphate synthase [Candidatus Binataceae bacterium]
MKFKIGQGFDFHPLQTGRRLVLGGVEIAHERGLLGHSDADVAAHALANAILGALGEGDLGRHFSDRDPAYRDADSLELLGEIWRRGQAAGWQIQNADVTVFAQRPRLAPYLEQMRVRLAQCLGLPTADLNIKASNPEGLGALGREEGMAAAAVVLLARD